MKAVSPDLIKLFGRLVEPRQLQRWRATGDDFLLDWPRFEPQYEQRVHVRSIEATLAELRSLGAQERCTAVTLQGTDFAVEGSLDELVRAVCLDELVWEGERAENTIVICDPGRLAFSKDDYADYFIYHRP